MDILYINKQICLFYLSVFCVDILDRGSGNWRKRTTVNQNGLHIGAKILSSLP